jgi:hypothetical protein
MSYESLAVITPPPSYTKTITNVGDLLASIKDWYEEQKPHADKFLSGVWLRGVSRNYKSPLCPGIYREEVNNKLGLTNQNPDESKRLNFERILLNEFRLSGANYLNANDILDVYFTAQHYGMPTRLLDWTTNPLTSLFFAAENHFEEDGEVYIMEAKKILDGSHESGLSEIIGMRHPYVKEAIGKSFWHEPEPGSERRPVIIPVRPDNIPGRIGQQSSCFTLHMHLANSCSNPTLSKYKVPACQKQSILQELRTLNISRFTIFNDLDHLSRDIRESWGL